MKNYEKLVDQNDLKIKHATGEYVNLSSVEPDDIIFFMLSKNKKKMKASDIVKFFGEEKEEATVASINFLISDFYASTTDDVNDEKGEVTDFSIVLM